MLYEESIPDSKQEVRALQSIMGTLNRWAGLGRQGGRGGRATSAAQRSLSFLHSWNLSILCLGHHQQRASFCKRVPLVPLT